MELCSATIVPKERSTNVQDFLFEGCQQRALPVWHEKWKVNARSVTMPCIGNEARVKDKIVLQTKPCGGVRTLAALGVMAAVSCIAQPPSIECDSNAACPRGFICREQICRLTCVSSGDCGERAACVEGLCQNGECESADDCKSPGTCALGASATCTAGRCVYPPALDDTLCDDGDLCTDDDRCVGQQCHGIARSCDEPPASHCTNAVTLAVAQSPGMCDAGACTYAWSAVACPSGCFYGVCADNPCAATSCDAVPAAICADAFTRRVFTAPGTCDDGICRFPFGDSFCPYGCAAGDCVGDPCAGVTCDEPPADICVDAERQRTFGEGWCSAGDCRFPSVDVTCPYGCLGGACAECTPSWQNVSTCGCTPTPCVNCTATLRQADGCGATREIACSVPAGGCAHTCVAGVCTPPMTWTTTRLDWSVAVGSYYRYAGTVVEDGARYLFTCANRVAGEVTDHVLMRRGTWNGTQWTFGAESVAVWPGTAGTWDARHVCDPDVVYGEFWYQRPGQPAKELYHYALFYTGANSEPETGGVNQIGWALASNWEGPWYKVVGYGPLVTANQWWGVGQPAVTAVEGGRVLLFYTRGDASGTRTVRQEIDLSDAHQPVFYGEVVLPTAGLTLADGAPDPLNHGGAFLYDATRDRFWLLRNGHPNPAGCVDWVSRYLQIASLPSGSVWSGNGTWTVHGQVTDTDLSALRVFDGGFVRNKWGGLLDPNRLQMVPSIATSCDADWLWTYRSHEVTGQIP